ncbi:origin recognition complex subunit 1 [Candida albicans P78048]|uniref:Origin recognition complex subunit 1 n=1 Tax=Candida albicans P78048 TaxID=1094989 RepID=A0AB34PZZ4_CANAX|nr:origin recognition complex subunit 1 [Candida albicans P78048]KGT72495.1 origin recognition complex subunit 1 [Candida albicans 12C]KHC61925.1 origin recognition complex subunit 1 [Candida albicans P37039]
MNKLPKGWNFTIVDDNADSSNSENIQGKRPRRSRTSVQRSDGASPIIRDNIVLIRTDDNEEFKVGDTIEITQGKGPEDPTTEYGLITEIKFGNSEFIEVIVDWFIRSSEIVGMPNDFFADNELLLTPFRSEVKFIDFIRPINVLSESQFADVVIDESNSHSTFLVKRATDNEGNFSDTFDYKDFSGKVLENPKKCAIQVKELISTTVQKELLKEFSKEQRKKKANKVSTTGRVTRFNKRKESVSTKAIKPENKQVRIEIDNDVLSDQSEEKQEESDYNEAEDANSALESDEENISQESEDSEVEYSTKKKLKNKKLSRRSKAAATPSPKRKLQKKDIEDIYSVVTPTKRMKLGKDDRDSLPVFLSPTKSVPSEFTDPKSVAFKEVKQRLHTSQKLNALPGREDEFAMIYMNLESAVNEKTGCCVYVCGVPGMGKTATIKDVVEQMTYSSERGEMEQFSYLELNGLKLLSPTVAYEALWHHISGDKVSASNAALLLEEYFKREDHKRKPLVILMDEFDQIATKKQNVMYNFFNWPTYSTSKLIVIAVANTMDLPERMLTNKIASRLGLRRIQFRGYTFQQLGDIITHRLEMITKNNRRKVVITSDAIGFASRKVASVSGDARRALTICRRAVEIAEKEYLENKKGEDDSEPYQVLISHISTAINETVNSPLSKYIASLPFASKLVLASLLRRSRRTGLAENSLGDIIDEMRNSFAMATHSEEQGSDELNMQDVLYSDKTFTATNETAPILNLRIHFFKQIVTSLVEAGIIIQQNSPGERSRLVKLDVPEEEVVSVFKKDNAISQFL